MANGLWALVLLPAVQSIAAPSGSGGAEQEQAVVVAIDSELSSKSARIDDYFPVRLAEPVSEGGRVLLPAGLRGEGQVVHVSRAKGLGKPGELIVAVRYLQCGPARIGLRGFRIDGAGRDNSGALVAASIAGGLVASPLLFIKGGEYVIPAGTRGRAKLAEPLPMRSAGGPVCTVDAARVPAAAPDRSQQGEKE